MPYYIQLCIETWKKFLPNFPVTILDNSNLREYIDISLYGSELFNGNFSLPQIADAVRVMVLKEYGGIWFDADTIILNSDAESYMIHEKDDEITFFGTPESRNVHLAFIQSTPKSRCMRLWVEYVKDKVQNFNPPKKDFWAYFGNSFINVYSKAFPEEINILDRRQIMPELPCAESTYDAYRDFYFLQRLHLTDIKNSMVLLHNSWTPEVFRKMDKNQLLSCDCTMANVLTEVLELDRSGINEFTTFHKYHPRRYERLRRAIFGYKEDKFAI